MGKIILIVLVFIALFIPLSAFCAWVSFTAVNHLFGTALVLTIHNWLAWIWLCLVVGGTSRASCKK